MMPELLYPNGLRLNERLVKFFLVPLFEYDLNNLVATDWIIIPAHQFEAGPVTTPYENRFEEVERTLSDRYYQRHSATGSQTLRYGTGYWNSTTSALCIVEFRTVMRRLPDYAWNALRMFAGASPITVTASSILTTSSSTKLANIDSDVAAGATTGQGTALAANNNTSSYLEFDAEL